MIRNRCACGNAAAHGALLCRACWFTVKPETREAVVTEYAAALKAYPVGTVNQALRNHDPYAAAAMLARSEARAARGKRS